ncbi:unnamed protein product [Bemisia tabaci]|uniref:Uncharacterized protein n=1 Tax=Bemisia tabaci TaxID=7038 RepID=A0A9P0EXW9_BEMTA|nr:unnamed protein product [Bemisia tabaci]
MEEISATAFAPDPYVTNTTMLLPNPHMTLSNLRDAVVFLSDPNTPIQYRRYFHERNPIPGARWNKVHRLLNPDAIMPPGYSNITLLDDLRRLRDYADSFKDKVLYAHGIANIDGKGSPAQLVSENCYVRNFTTQNKLEQPHYVGQLEEHFSVRSLQSSDWFVGTPGLFGEIPDDFSISETIALPRRAFDSRSNNGAVERFTGERVTDLSRGEAAVPGALGVPRDPRIRSQPGLLPSTDNSEPAAKDGGSQVSVRNDPGQARRSGDDSKGYWLQAKAHPGPSEAP